MKKVSNFGLDDFSISADDYCVISTQKDAEEFFAQCEFTGKVALEEVTPLGAELNSDVKLKNGKSLADKKFLWVCHGSDGGIVYRSLFKNELYSDEIIYTQSKPVNTLAMIMNNGIIFIVCQDAQGGAIVRALTMLFCQLLVLGMAEMQGIKVKDLYLVKMHRIADNKYIAPCWNIVYEEKNDDGELIDANMLQPVDVRDAGILDEIGLNRLNSSIVYENETVDVHGVYYKLKMDADGGRYLLKNPLQVSNANTKWADSLERAEVSANEQKAEKSQSSGPAKIMHLYKKGGQ